MMEAVIQLKKSGFPFPEQGICGTREGERR